MTTSALVGWNANTGPGPAALHAQGDLGGTDHGRHGERRHRITATRYHGGGEQDDNHGEDGPRGGTGLAGGELRRADHQQRRSEQAVRVPRMIA